MTAKTLIIEHLGENALLLPARIRAGLDANDRAKVLMSALQAAVEQAFGRGGAASDLHAEARSVGLEAERVRGFIRGATAQDGERFAAPGAVAIAHDLGADIEAMIAAAGAAGDDVSAFQVRFAALAADLATDGDGLDRAQVARITAAGTKSADSLHRLIMDLHKALNRLAADHAEEDVAGARCSGLAGDDRQAVSAFMAGVEATRKLKFDHPGLDTTAARAGERLLIQNDIGTTDAHVLCVTVTEAAVDVTYTDVHRSRAKFFIGLFSSFEDVVWTAPSAHKAEGLAEGAAFEFVTAHLDVADPRRRDTFLSAVGAALVFLIDWNKARKQLQRFVDKDDAIRVLDWAARRRLGHRAFLELGGADLVNGAIQRAADGHIGYGVRLDHAIGEDQAVDFLRQALRIACEGLLAARSDRLIRDAIDAELVRRLERSGSTLLQGVVTQAGLARSILAGLAEALGHGDAVRAAATAKRIEEKADRLAIDLRATAERLKVEGKVAPLIDQVEQAIDDVEEASFFLSLLQGPGIDAGNGDLTRLVATATRAAEAVARMADAASAAADGHRIDMDDALAAMADLFALEHAADDEERAALAATLRTETDPRRTIVLTQCARRIEAATDRFAHAGHLMRAHLLGELNRHADADRL